MACSKYQSTKQTTNAARVSRLLLDPCTDLLRDVLRQNIPETSISGKLQRDTLTIKPLLNASQRNMLYPQNGTFAGNYQDFDISLLYILLRNISGIKQHSKGWGKTPDPNDRSVSANIERIRIIRNSYIGHINQSALSDLQFNSVWQDARIIASELVKDLRLTTDYVGLIDRLKHETMDPEQEEAYLKRLDDTELPLADLKDTLMSRETQKIKGQIGGHWYMTKAWHIVFTVGVIMHITVTEYFRTDEEDVKNKCNEGQIVGVWLYITLIAIGVDIIMHRFITDDFLRAVVDVKNKTNADISNVTITGPSRMKCKYAAKFVKSKSSSHPLPPHAIWEKNKQTNDISCSTYNRSTHTNDISCSKYNRSTQTNDIFCSKYNSSTQTELIINDSYSLDSGFYHPKAMYMKREKRSKEIHLPLLEDGDRYEEKSSRKTCGECVHIEGTKQDGDRYEEKPSRKTCGECVHIEGTEQGKRNCFNKVDGNTRFRGFYQKIIEVCESVAMIAERGHGCGTGFMVGENLLMSALHVFTTDLNFRNFGKNVIDKALKRRLHDGQRPYQAIFGYYKSANETKCDVFSFAEVVYYNVSKDCIVLKLVTTSEIQLPPALRLRSDEQHILSPPKYIVFGHPDEKPLQIDEIELETPNVLKELDANFKKKCPIIYKDKDCYEIQHQCGRVYFHTLFEKCGSGAPVVAISDTGLDVFVECIVQGGLPNCFWDKVFPSMVFQNNSTTRIEYGLNPGALFKELSADRPDLCEMLFPDRYDQEVEVSMDCDVE